MSLKSTDLNHKQRMFTLWIYPMSFCNLVYGPSTVRKLCESQLFCGIFKFCLMCLYLRFFPRFYWTFAQLWVVYSIRYCNKAVKRVTEVYVIHLAVTTVKPRSWINDLNHNESAFKITESKRSVKDIVWW